MHSGWAGRLRWLRAPWQGSSRHLGSVCVDEGSHQPLYNRREMTTPAERVQGEIKTALKEGDKDRLATLRLLLNSIKNEAIRSGSEVDEDGFLKLVRKAIKQRRDSAEQYRAGGRAELAEKEEREGEILAAYLPEEAGEDEIRAAIEALVAEQELAGPAAIGVVMKAMMARFSGRADGGVINRLAREILGS